MGSVNGPQSVTVGWAAEHMEPHALVIDFAEYDEMRAELEALAKSLNQAAIAQSRLRAELHTARHRIRELELQVGAHQRELSIMRTRAAGLSVVRGAAALVEPPDSQGRRSARQRLMSGMLARVIFANGERAWVRVGEYSGGEWVGKLQHDPERQAGLKADDVLVFAATHVDAVRSPHE